MAVLQPVGSDEALASSITAPQGVYMYGGIYEQEDVVGQYLAREAVRKSIIEGLQASGSHYANGYARHAFQGHQSVLFHDSYADGHTQPWYPDPEQIRHLHTLHSLLPHIQPERKLNALSGLELDIVEGHSGNTFCHAVPKKMLVLFLGRKIVSKFLHTVQREDNETWSGSPTQQNLVLPCGVASAAAITILVTWMTRACKSATMYTMKQIRVPTNLFAACSLAQTLEVFGLHRDAYRLDLAISQQFSKRPIYAVELETLWNCLGERSKYVYGCISVIKSQLRDSETAEDLQGLEERCPRLYARICDFETNEEYKPQFGREWFRRLESGDGEYLQAGISNSEAPTIGHVRGPRTPDTHAQGVRALNPSAPTFRSMGTRE